MKILFTYLMLLCSVSMLAQDIEPLIFEEVIEVDNVTKKELHARCLNWFAETFNNSNEVLRSSADDQLIAKPLIIYKPSMVAGSDWIKGTISYTVKVQFKDNKYRYIISNFYHHGNPNAKYRTLDFGELLNGVDCPYKFKSTTKKWNNKVWKDLQNNSKETAKILIESLNSVMSKMTSDNDDW